MNLHASFLAAIVLCLAPKALPAAEPAARPKLDNPFFAFDNGTGRGKVPPAVQAQMLKDLGYAGIGYTGTAKIPEMLGELDARGLKMYSTYVGLRLDGEKPVLDPGLEQACEQLRGRETILWLFVIGKGPASDEKDAQAVAQIRQLGQWAEKSGLQVALYPHHGFYVARVEDAIRLADKADRKNVGVSLNLCHWLRSGDEANLELRLKQALPRLMLVSVNGADHEGDWDRLIQTLDRGEFDVYRFLKALRRAGYAGPIGLQCYNIKGDERENLQRSITAWKKFVARMEEE
jgi:sugar phosphate isomerase/epimerase